MNVSDNMAEESTLTVAQESLVTLKQYMNPYDISILLSTFIALCHSIPCRSTCQYPMMVIFIMVTQFVSSIQHQRQHFRQICLKAKCMMKRGLWGHVMCQLQR